MKRSFYKNLRCLVRNLAGSPFPLMPHSLQAVRQSPGIFEENWSNSLSQVGHCCTFALIPILFVPHLDLSGNDGFLSLSFKNSFIFFRLLAIHARVNSTLTLSRPLVRKLVSPLFSFISPNTGSMVRERKV